MPNIQGVYRYIVGGATVVLEPWEISQEDADTWDITVDRIAESGPKLSLKAKVGPQGSFFSFAFAPDGGNDAVATAQYRTGKNGIEYRSPPDDKWRCQASANYLFFPLMRLWMGPLVSTLAKRGWPAPVMVPSIKDPDDLECLFAPLSSQRKAIEDPSRAGIFLYEGGEYAAPIEVEIDPSGLMQRYQWQPRDSQLWECRLELSKCAQAELDVWTGVRAFL